MSALYHAQVNSACDQILARMAAAEAPDAMIRDPLWTWHPLAAKAVLSERRRRFGIADERIDPSTLPETEDDECVRRR